MLLGRTHRLLINTAGAKFGNNVNMTATTCNFISIEKRISNQQEAMDGSQS